jgi:hypothetical protein
VELADLLLPRTASQTPRAAHLLDDDHMEPRGDGDDSVYGPDSYRTHSKTPTG